MLTLETGKKVVVIVLGSLIALAIHQKFVAPLLVKKPALASK